MTPIQIVPYDPAWPEDFARIEAELQEALTGVGVVALCCRRTSDCAIVAAVKRGLADEGLNAEQYGASKSDIIEEILIRGGLSGPERASIRSGNESITARRGGDDEVIADDGRSLWVEETGAAGAPSVVFCHGGPGSADHLEELRDLLVDAGLRVIRWDQRGAGRSTREGPFTVDRFVADLESVRRVVAGGPCWLVGHSWGANLALAHAQMHSQGLLGVAYICGTGLDWWPDHAERHNQAQVERLGPELGSRLVELRGKERTSEEDDEYRLLYLRSDLADIHDVALARRLREGERRFPVNRAVHAAINSELAGWDLSLQRSRCLGVTVPVLVVDGDADPRPVWAVDSLVSALKDATRATVRGAGHWPWLEQSQQTGRILAGFLAGISVPEGNPF